MELSMMLPPPLAPSLTRGEDTNFALSAAGVWGPFLSTWRVKQMSSLEKSRRALASVNQQLVSRMHPYVSKVAAQRS